MMISYTLVNLQVLTVLLKIHLVHRLPIKNARGISCVYQKR